MRDFILCHVKLVTGKDGDIATEVGENVDIATEEGKVVDIVVEEGKVAAIVGADTWRADGLPQIDCAGQYVSSGWIDMHAHAFAELSPYGDDINEIGVKQGVTTIVDAGSCGSDRIGELAARANKANTNVLAFLNVSRIGLARTDELSNMAWLDAGQAARCVRDHADFIVGLKARMSRSVVGDNGLEPLRTARTMSQATKLPLMVHIGSAPPPIEEILSHLHKGDMVTHYLHGKRNGLWDHEGKPIPAFADALRRGVHLDIGHGSASFSFRAAEAARRNHIAPDTISTDIYRANRLNGPVHSLAHVLTKFLFLGYRLDEVIAAVTSRAARWLGRPELGRIQVGDTANLTLFRMLHEPCTLVDSEGNRRAADYQIKTTGAVANGNFHAGEIRA